jgi:protein-tyrosine-phosphatase
MSLRQNQHERSQKHAFKRGYDLSNVIPDPYYVGDQGFEHVLDLIEEASEGLMKFTLQKVKA